MWLEKYPAPSRHECVLPSPFAAGMGSVWMCDDCGKRYRVVKLVAGADQRNGDYEWMTVHAAEPSDMPRDNAVVAAFLLAAEEFEAAAKAGLEPELNTFAASLMRRRAERYRDKTPEEKP